MREELRMPLQRQTTVFTYPDKLNLHSIDTSKGSFEDLAPTVEAAPSTPTSSSSWKLLRKLFKESKSLSNDANHSKKVRRASCEQFTSSSGERPSPTTFRKLSLHRQRKSSSTSKSPPIKSRKFASVNHQENLLHYFVIESDVSTLQKILQNKKVDVNSMRHPGLSPLHTACVLGDLDVVELLMTHGADINLKSWSGLSPFQITSLFGHFDVAQYLMRNGASMKDIQDGCNGDAKLMQTVLVSI